MNKFIIYLGLLHTFVLSPVDKAVNGEGKGNAPSPVPGSNAVKKALPRVVELKNVGIRFERRDGMQNNRQKIFLPSIDKQEPSIEKHEP